MTAVAVSCQNGLYFFEGDGEFWRGDLLRFRGLSRRRFRWGEIDHLEEVEPKKISGFLEGRGVGICASQLKGQFVFSTSERELSELDNRGNRDLWAEEVHSTPEDLAVKDH